MCIYAHFNNNKNKTKNKITKKKKATKKFGCLFIVEYIYICIAFIYICMRGVRNSISKSRMNFEIKGNKDNDNAPIIVYGWLYYVAER